ESIDESSKGGGPYPRGLPSDSFNLPPLRRAGGGGTADIPRTGIWKTRRIVAILCKTLEEISMTIRAVPELLAGHVEGHGTVSQSTFNIRAYGSPEFVAVWVKEDAPRAEAEMLSHGVDYSVTQQPNAHTGRVNLLPSGKYPALPTGYLIAIAGVFPEFQGIPCRASERFFAVRHEFAYDYTVNLIKQLRRDIQRVFDIPDSPFEAPRIWINGVTLEEYVRLLADAEVERAFAPKTPVLVTGPELFLGLESHRAPYILLNECTVYVPLGMPPGWTCDFQRAGGPVTFDTPEGMQWWSVDVAKTIQHQYAWANLTCIESNIMRDRKSVV